MTSRKSFTTQLVDKIKNAVAALPEMDESDKHNVQVLVIRVEENEEVLAAISALKRNGVATEENEATRPPYVLSDTDVDLVLSQTSVTREEAEEELKRSNGDVVNAIMELCSK